MRPRFLRSLLPALVLAALPAVSRAGMFIGVSVNAAPPPLPVYVQPPCPEPGYLWAPGYWAWGPYGYYWVPGTWVLPPQVGLLWTPGWWGWDAEGDDYLWHAGYWGPQVGFYGGIDYGFGYDGDGYEGGYWHRGVFFYNRAVVNVGPTFVTNVYYRPVYHPMVRHVSFNGGPDGIRARPTRRDMLAARERHFGVTSAQQRQIRMAGRERALRANFNHGRPPIAATLRPAQFHGRGVIGARAAGGPVHMQRGPMRMQQHAPRMRSDRPPWASGQGRPVPRIQRSGPRGYGRPLRLAQPGYHPQRPQSRQPPQWRAPQQRSFHPPQQYSYRAPQGRFQPRGNWSAPRPAMPQYRPPAAQRFQGWQGGPRGGGRPMAQPRGHWQPQRGARAPHRGPPGRRG